MKQTTARLDDEETDTTPGLLQSVERSRCVVRGDNRACHGSAVLQPVNQPATTRTGNLLVVNGKTYITGVLAGPILLPPGKRWVGVRERRVVLPLSPDGGMQQIGVQTVDGVRTAQYRFSTTMAQPNMPTRRVRAVVDVWIDLHHLLRRATLTIPPHAAIRYSAQYYDFGVAVPPITAPPADQVATPTQVPAR